MGSYGSVAINDLKWGDGPRWARVTRNIFALLAIVNIVAYFGMVLYLGGDAMNGKIENGHYFLASKSRLTEVSREVWTYSWWHTIAIWITQPLGIAAVWVWVAAAKRSKSRATKVPTRGP